MSKCFCFPTVRELDLIGPNNFQSKVVQVKLKLTFELWRKSLPYNFN